MSLAARLAAVIFLGALVPLALAGALILNQIEDSVLEQARRSRVDTAHRAATLTHDHIAGAEAKLRWIAMVLEAELVQHPSDPAWLETRLGELVEQADVFLNLTFEPAAEHAPVQQVRGGPRTAEQQLSGSNTANFLNENGWNLFAPVTASGPGSGPGLSIETAVAPDGRLVGCVDLAPLATILRQAAGTSGRALEILDDAGGTIARHGDVPPPAEETRLGVPGRSWEVVVREPRDAILADVRAARRRAIGWLALAAALALGLSGLLAAWLVRPIRSLTRTVGEIEKGRLDARADVRREDELGRLAEALNRMAASLEQLDRMKSEFVATVSHELRTPLTSALCSLDNLRVLGDVNDKQGRAIDRTRADLDRLIRLVNELLDLQALHAGGAPLAPGPVDAASFTREVAESVREIAARKRLDLAVDAPASAPARFDAARMRQVLLNLLDNAIKFTPDGGRVAVALVGTGGGIEWRVDDTGPGVKPEDRERIFERFTKASTSPGVGLGLTIARRIVELHGGTIRAEARNGGGARFVVSLPCRAS